jgi:hypothetical protein
MIMEPLDLKPKPLKPNAKVLDRVEYLFQWLVWKLVVNRPEYPGLSAMITSVRLITFLLLIIGAGYGVWFLINHYWR